MNLFLRIFRHLLPHARTWRLIIVDRPIKDFFTGLTEFSADVKEFIDLVYLDLFPQTTRDIPAWENHFGLLDTGMTTQQRRDRLDGAWKAFGGQDPRYIQDTLQNAGFDVYIHEWWEPGSSPPNARNPNDFLRENSLLTVYDCECAEAVAECGEALAACGESSEPPGYPLVNKITESVKNLTSLCGESIMGCGETAAACGNFTAFVFEQKQYTVSSDPNTFPYYLYIGGSTFGTLATIEANRRDEFEDLCLKICPLQQWLGILVNYQ